MGRRGGVVKRVAFSIMLLCLITLSGISGTWSNTISSKISYNNFSSYGIKNIFYYPSYNSLVRKVIPTVNGFYVVGNYFILFKSPNLQVPIRVTPVLYSDAFANGYNILANNTI